MISGIPLIQPSRLWHVGQLDTAARTGRASLEAFMLSVSRDPEDWRGIAHCAGPVWEIGCPETSMLDALALTPDHLAEIAGWGLRQGHALERQLWRAWFFDDEGETWRYMVFEDEATARYEAEETEDAGYLAGEIPSLTGEAVDSLPGHVLTEAGMAALERWHDPSDGLEGLIILWAREVLQAEMPGLIGVWWEETHDPLALSLPRGGIFPERLGELEIRGPDGARPPEVTSDDLEL